MRSILCLATMLAASGLAAAEAPLTIDQLLAQGWEIAGYASGHRRTSSCCSAIRNPSSSAASLRRNRNLRTIINCYELREGAISEARMTDRQAWADSRINRFELLPRVLRVQRAVGARCRGPGTGGRRRS